MAREVKIPEFQHSTVSKQSCKTNSCFSCSFLWLVHTEDWEVKTHKKKIGNLIWNLNLIACTIYIHPSHVLYDIIFILIVRDVSLWTVLLLLQKMSMLWIRKETRKKSDDLVFKELKAFLRVEFYPCFCHQFLYNTRLIN